ncbi:MAG: DUF5996 family protein [Anaerolineae bacterium]|nr:DUF5996 family protein [Anaerolineae bacterium]
MPLPALENFSQTRTSLQHAAQVLSAIRKATTPQLPNALRLSLQVVPQGLTTGPLSFGGALLLDFAQAAVVYHSPDQTEETISLVGHHSRSLRQALLPLLSAVGPDLQGVDVTDETPFEIDPTTAADYAQALYTIFTAVARFRARLFGPQSPIVVWPHGFDLSTLWFSGSGADEHHDPHMNFGFSPASPGFDRPYFYSYAYPLPQGYHAVALPPAVQTIHEPFSGMIFSYDDMVSLYDPEAEIEHLFVEIFRAVSPLMREESSDE